MPKPIVPALIPPANLLDSGGIPVDGGKIRTGRVLRADDGLHSKLVQAVPAQV